MKIKFLITLLICYILFTGYACKCSSFETTTSQYLDADFVGLVKILKTHKNDIDTIDRYRVDVETISLLKGRAINTLITEGFNDIPNRWSSCGVVFTLGRNYLVYGKINKKDGKVYVFYCGVTSYAIDKEIELINKIKPYAKGLTVNTRWGRTTYLPSQMYMRFNPDSSEHISLVKVDINKRTNEVSITHITSDDNGLKLILKDVFENKVNWRSKLKDEDYPEEKYSLIFELHPYTRSTYLRDKGHLLN